MASLLRIVFWMVWALGAGWLWHAGVLEVPGTAAALALGSALALWQRNPARRRRGELRYVEMGKEPVGFS